MKFLTKFSKEKIDKNKDKEFDLAHIKRVNHLLRSTMIHSSILFWIMAFGIKSPLIASFLVYVDCFFGYSMVYTLDSIKKFYQVYHHTHILSKYKLGGKLGLRDSYVRFFLLEISFVSSGGRPHALSLCFYHDYHLRPKQGGEQRAEYFCFRILIFFPLCLTSCKQSSI